MSAPFKTEPKDSHHGVTSGELEEHLIDIAVTLFFVDVKVEQSAAQKLLKGRNQKPYSKRPVNADQINAAS